MSIEAQAVHYEPAVDAMVEWSTDEVLVTGTGPFFVVGPPGSTTEITKAELDAIAADDALPEGAIWNVTDAGFLAVRLTASTYRTFYAIHVGSTEPADQFAVWIKTEE